MCPRTGIKTTYVFLTISHSIRCPESPQCSVTGRQATPVCHHQGCTLRAGWRQPGLLWNHYTFWGRCCDTVCLRRYFEFPQGPSPTGFRASAGWAITAFWLVARGWLGEGTRRMCARGGRAQCPSPSTCGPFVDTMQIGGSSGSGLVMKPVQGPLSLMSIF